MAMHAVIEDPRVFIRGFILADKLLKPHDFWKTVCITYGHESLYFSYDPRNNAVYMEGLQYYVLVLGTMMDVEEYTMDNVLIASILLDRLHSSKDSFYDKLDLICGRYIVLYGRMGEKPILVQDATGMRSVFYDENKFIIASHIELVQIYANEEIAPIWNEYNNHFDNVENTNIGLPGNSTPYCNIKALIPNHELQTISLSQRRFWPRRHIVYKNIDDVCEEAFDCFKKQAHLLTSHSKKVCVSLTGGIDSGITAKAFENELGEIEYFTYYDPKETIKGGDTHADSAYAELYCMEHGLKWRKLVLEEKPSSETLDICRANTWQRHITRVVDKYLEHYSDDYIHIRSNLLEIVRERSTYTSKNIQKSPDSYYRYRYASCNKDLFMKAIEGYWQNSDFKHIFDYDFFDIFYWEYRCGMWHGGSVLLESDLAFETYCLFNYRKFLQDMLSVPKEDLNTNLLYEKYVRLNHDGIIRKM